MRIMRNKVLVYFPKGVTSNGMLTLATTDDLFWPLWRMTHLLLFDSIRMAVQESDIFLKNDLTNGALAPTM